MNQEIQDLYGRRVITLAMKMALDFDTLKNAAPAPQEEPEEAF